MEPTDSTSSSAPSSPRQTPRLAETTGSSTTQRTHETATNTITNSPGTSPRADNQGNQALTTSTIINSTAPSLTPQNSSSSAKASQTSNPHPNSQEDTTTLSLPSTTGPSSASSTDPLKRSDQDQPPSREPQTIREAVKAAHKAVDKILDDQSPECQLKRDELHQAIAAIAKLTIQTEKEKANEMRPIRPLNNEIQPATAQLLSLFQTDELQREVARELDLTEKLQQDSGQREAVLDENTRKIQESIADIKATAKKLTRPKSKPLDYKFYGSALMSLVALYGCYRLQSYQTRITKQF